MYTQSLDLPGNVAPADASIDTVEKARFDAAIASDRKIEPQGWMPEASSQAAGAADFVARALRNRRHAAQEQEEHEVRDGLVLTCQCHPVSERVVISYDGR